MELKITRTYKKDKYTIGDLYINGEWFSSTLEDKDRGLDFQMSEYQIKKNKIAGETAIPTGTYKVAMNIISPKFKNTKWAKPYGGRVPRLLDVKGFESILIHPGNTAQDSSGCILVGLNKAVGKVLNSTDTYLKLMEILTKESNKGNSIYITIE